MNEVKKTKVLMLVGSIGIYEASLISNRNRSTNCHVETLFKDCGVVLFEVDMVVIQNDSPAIF